MKKTFVSIFLLVMLLTFTATTPVSANLYYGLYPRGEFGNFMVEVVKLNPQVKDFHRMYPGESYNLPGGETDTLTTDDIDGVWGRELRKLNDLYTDPVTSGDPYVEGGISENDPDRLETYFQNRAGYISNGRGVAVRISAIEKGTISGEGLVGYFTDGFKPKRIETPIRAYQARFRFPDGSEEVVQTLQGCMNPVISGSGDVYKGFIFIPDGVVVPLDNDKKGNSTNFVFLGICVGVFLLFVGLVGWAVINKKSSLTTDNNFVEPTEKPKRVRPKREVVKIKFLEATARKGSEIIFDGDPNKYKVTETKDGFNLKRIKPNSK